MYVMNKRFDFSDQTPERAIYDMKVLTQDLEILITALEKKVTMYCADKSELFFILDCIDNKRNCFWSEVINFMDNKETLDYAEKIEELIEMFGKRILYLNSIIGEVGKNDNSTQDALEQILKVRIVIANLFDYINRLEGVLECK